MDPVTVVKASAEWEHCGLRTDPDTRLRIDALSGRWRALPQEPPCGAAGHPGQKAPSDAPLPGAPLGALLGRVGSTVFLLGERGVVPPALNGALELRINDSPAGLADNSGSLNVKIQAARPARGRPTLGVTRSAGLRVAPLLITEAIQAISLWMRPPPRGSAPRVLLSGVVNGASFMSIEADGDSVWFTVHPKDAFQGGLRPSAPPMASPRARWPGEGWAHLCLNVGSYDTSLTHNGTQLTRVELHEPFQHRAATFEVPAGEAGARYAGLALWESALYGNKIDELTHRFPSLRDDYLLYFWPMDEGFGALIDDTLTHASAEVPADGWSTEEPPIDSVQFCKVGPAWQDSRVCIFARGARPVRARPRNGCWTVGREQLGFGGGSRPAGAGAPLPEAPMGALIAQVGPEIVLIGDGAELPGLGPIRLGANLSPAQLAEARGSVAVDLLLPTDARVSRPGRGGRAGADRLAIVQGLQQQIRQQLAPAEAEAARLEAKAHEDAAAHIRAEHAKAVAGQGRLIISAWEYLGYFSTVPGQRKVILSGSDISLGNNGPAGTLALDNLTSKLYRTTTSENPWNNDVIFALTRCDLDGGNAEEVISTAALNQNWRIHALAIHAVDRQLYFLARPVNNEGRPRLEVFRVSIDALPVRTPQDFDRSVRSIMILPFIDARDYELRIDAARRLLFVLNGGDHIGSFNIPNGDNPRIFLEPKLGSGLSLDEAKGHIYFQVRRPPSWYPQSKGKFDEGIWRTDYDGNNAVRIFNGCPSDDHVKFLHLDTTERTLYHTQWNQIYRRPLDAPASQESEKICEGDFHMLLVQPLRLLSQQHQELLAARANAGAVNSEKLKKGTDDAAKARADAQRRLADAEASAQTQHEAARVQAQQRVAEAHRRLAAAETDRARRVREAEADAATQRGVKLVELETQRVIARAEADNIQSAARAKLNAKRQEVIDKVRTAGALEGALSSPNPNPFETLKRIV